MTPAAQALRSICGPLQPLRQLLLEAQRLQRVRAHCQEQLPRYAWQDNPQDEAQLGAVQDELHMVSQRHSRLEKRLQMYTRRRVSQRLEATMDALRTEMSQLREQQQQLEEQLRDLTLKNHGPRQGSAMLEQCIAHYQAQEKAIEQRLDRQLITLMVTQPQGCPLAHLDPALAALPDEQLQYHAQRLTAWERWRRCLPPAPPASDQHSAIDDYEHLCDAVEEGIEDERHMVNCSLLMRGRGIREHHNTPSMVGRSNHALHHHHYTVAISIRDRMSVRFPFLYERWHSAPLGKHLADYTEHMREQGFRQWQASLSAETQRKYLAAQESLNWLRQHLLPLVLPKAV